MEGNEIVRGHSTHVTLQPFIHQVGGHSSIQQIDHFTVCKPLFSKELRFYEDVCPAFKPFIPEFKGVVTVRNPSEGEDKICQVTSSRDDIKLHVYRYGKHCNTCSCRREGYVSKKSGQGTDTESFSSDEEFDKNTSTLNSDGHSHDDSSLEYILLENAVGRYKYPCILDLKMGTEKHKDYVISKEEADRRQARWDETTSKSLGVRVCGMKVYLVSKSGFFAKSGGRDLTIQGFKDAIKTFLYNGERSRCDVIEPFLKQLGELLNVMENQSSYRFYNTSLLLIYEGEYYTRTDEDIVDCKNNFDDSQLTLPNEPKKSCANVGVRMIDFAHVHYNNQSSNSGLRHVRDESYLFGLRSVIQILKETLVELRTKEPCIS